MPKPTKYETSEIKTTHMGQVVEEMMKAAEGTRRGFERKAYDNSFFDDGYHFRYVSRTQNKIIDLTKESEMYHGIRAIPKASRQIRGMVNLLVSNDYVPRIYPERVDKTQYPDIQRIDPQTGQPVTLESPAYKEAIERSKDMAKKVGFWMTEEMGEENQDLKTKLAFGAVLAAKHAGISYLQVYPDAIHEKIVVKNRDFFDVYLMGDQTEIEDSPFVIVGSPRNIAEIKADERFDEKQRASINPDNRHASSEIKQAYMNTRYGKEFGDDRSATVVQKEAYIREFLNSENIKRISKQKNGKQILEERDYGDTVIRQVFSAGNVWLRDKYIDLRSYPLVDMRFEYGPLYQVAPIERFISANKSLDVIASRVERYANSFPLGVIAKRQGEKYKMSNIPGGQMVEYKSVPPQFQTVGNLPPFLFNYMNFLDSLIQEQGVSTSTLGNLPKGVKGWQAIESLKESEYANLVISDRMLKRTVRVLAEKFLELADQYFVTPQSVYHEEKGEPRHFDVIGKTALSKRDELKIETEEDVVPISRKYRVKVEVQKGMAYTREGRKNYARELGDYFLQLVQIGVVQPQTVISYIETLLSAYEFGPAEDIMESIKKGGSMPDIQMQKMKIALAEVIKDTGLADDKTDEARDVEKAKLGAAQAIKDTGIADGQKENQKPPSKSIPFKDLPASGKVQAARQAGIEISEEEVIRDAVANEKIKGINKKDGK